MKRIPGGDARRLDVTYQNYVFPPWVRRWEVEAFNAAAHAVMRPSDVWYSLRGTEVG